MTEIRKGSLDGQTGLAHYTATGKTMSLTTIMVMKTVWSSILLEMMEAGGTTTIAKRK
jgi:hypothetical protein